MVATFPHSSMNMEELSLAPAIPYCMVVLCQPLYRTWKKESGEVRIQFWFHTCVTCYDMAIMNVIIICDGAITVQHYSCKEFEKHLP